MAIKLKWKFFSGRQLLRGLGYTAFVLVMTFLFTYLTLPFEKIKNRFIATAEARLNADIVGKIDKSWFTGLSIKNLRITPRAPVAPGAKPPPAFEVEEGSLRVALLPLFVGRVRLDFALKLAEGEVSGRFTHKRDGDDIEATLSGVDLKTLPLRSAMGGKELFGIASGSASLFLGNDLSQSNGKIDLTVDNAKLGAFQVPIAQFGNQPITIPELTLGKLQAPIEIVDGAATFKDVKLSGSPDVEAAVEGYALLRKPFGQTELRAYLKFKLGDAFFKRNPKFAILQGDASLKAGQRPDGFSGFLVEGPVGVPQLLRRIPSPQPPGNLTPPKGGAAPLPKPGVQPPPPGAPPRPMGGPSGAPPPPRGPREAYDAVNRRLGK